MTELIIADESRIPEILELERRIFTPPWSEGSFLSETDTPDAFFAAAVEGGRTVGYCVLHKAGDEGELYKIAVAPEARRRGTAAMLLEAALDHAGANRLSRVFLEVRCSNEPAIALYRKFGFAYAGRRRNYYLSPVEDAAIMSLTLAE